MMNDIEAELDRMDGDQRENCRKLAIRLTSELAMDDNVLRQIALKESERDQILTGVLAHSEGKDAGVEIIEDQILQLKVQRVGVLLTMKSSNWNSSNYLKKAHEKRNIIRARSQELEEIGQQEA